MVFSGGQKIFLSIVVFFLLAGHVQAASNTVYILEVDGIIDSVTSRYVSEGIEIAEQGDAEAIVIQLDTPGGLDLAMRDIIKDVLESEVPIVVYVYPSGSRAASAGSFVMVAAHIAAMAPGTNIGAAHPVALGVGGSGEVSEKVVNDAAAYMRSIAELKGRNVKVAESFVYNSTSLTARDALELGIVDVVADGYDNLLENLDGQSVETSSGKKTLSTKDAEIIRRPMSTTERFLHTISNPTVAYLLFLAGMYGIIFELQNPGGILPGVIGGISILLALWSFQALSLSATGIALIGFALVLFIAELYTPSMGILSAGGIISFVMGSVMLINAEKEPYVTISLTIIILTAIITALFFVFAIGITLKTQRKKPATGAEGMVGLVGTAKTDISPDGTVFIHGELWKARAPDGAISKGRKAKVVGVEGLTLIVEEA